MVELDEYRLRYPNDYVPLKGGRISQINVIQDIVEFVLTSESGWSILCRGNADLAKGIKEGTIVNGNAEGVIHFRFDGKNLSDARPYMKLETWENVEIQ